MRERIVGALETGCRWGEMLLICKRHVHWDTSQILIPAEYEGCGVQGGSPSAAGKTGGPAGAMALPGARGVCVRHGSVAPHGASRDDARLLAEGPVL